MFDISLNSLIDELGEGAYESGRWCQVSLDQGALVSTTTLRVATNARHRHTEKLSGDTYQPLYSPKPAKIASSKLQDLNLCKNPHDFFFSCSDHQEAVKYSP